MKRIFYIPGFGEHYDDLRRAALERWCVRDVRAELIIMNWYDSEPYDVKYQRARNVIQAAINNGDNVSLVGESAGASMAISLFVQMSEVRRLVTIAGFNNLTIPVAPSVLRRAPEFGTAVRIAHLQLTGSNTKRRSLIHTVNGFYDRVVSVTSSNIPGAHSHRSLTIGHLLTIAMCLTLQKRRIIRYATSRG